MRETVWKFIRDDVWSYFSLVLFAIGCIGLMVPSIYHGISSSYGWAVLLVGASALTFRIVKIGVLICYGRLVRAELRHVEQRARGICVVSYAYRDSKSSINGSRQIYLRNGTLEVLYLPWCPRFHLVAWADQAR